MTWQQVYTLVGSQMANPVVVSDTFTSPALIVRADSSGALRSWHKAGLLYPVINIPEIGLVKGTRRKINLETQVVEFSFLGGLQYTAEFLIFGWLPDITLTFWEEVAG